MEKDLRNMTKEEIEERLDELNYLTTYYGSQDVYNREIKYYDINDENFFKFEVMNKEMGELQEELSRRERENVEQGEYELISDKEIEERLDELNYLTTYYGSQDVYNHEIKYYDINDENFFKFEVMNKEMGKLQEELSRRERENAEQKESEVSSDLVTENSDEKENVVDTINYSETTIKNNEEQPKYEVNPNLEAEILDEDGNVVDTITYSETTIEDNEEQPKYEVNPNLEAEILDEDGNVVDTITYNETTIGNNEEQPKYEVTPDLVAEILDENGNVVDTTTYRETVIEENEKQTKKIEGTKKPSELPEPPKSLKPPKQPEEPPRLPKPIDMSIEWQEPKTIKINQQEIDDMFNEKKQDMLDKFYGNKEKEKEYTKAIKRYKSHIVEKEFTYVGKDKQLKTGVYKTVEEYDGKDNDEDFLQLGEYSQRLERLSKAEAGCDDEYRLIAERYERNLMEDLEETFNSETEMQKKLELKHAIKNLKNNMDANIEEDIKKLMKNDNNYIETNNYAYNQHQATQENLKTLGKYGENVKYMTLTKNEGLTGLAKNVVIGGSNVFLFVRNNILARISRGVGKYIAAPIHKKIFKPEKNTSGIYKGLRTHRYTARKDHLLDIYTEELKEKNKERIKQGKKIKKPSMLKQLVGVRWDAITKYKEGNAAVLSAGAHDIESSIEESYVQNKQREAIIEAYERTKENMLMKISTIEEQLENCKDEGRRRRLEKNLEEGLKNLKIIDKTREREERKGKKDIIQTDAISMEQHSKTNKSNMTKVVTGIKALAVKFLGPKIPIYDDVKRIHHGKKRTWINRWWTNDSG